MTHHKLLLSSARIFHFGFSFTIFVSLSLNNTKRLFRVENKAINTSGGNHQGYSLGLVGNPLQGAVGDVDCDGKLDVIRTLQVGTSATMTTEQHTVLEVWLRGSTDS